MDPRVSALERPAAELTVVDVYDIAALLGREFERLIEAHGCEAVVGLVPKVVRVLELLEALVNYGGGGRFQAEELQRELDRLRQERDERLEQDRKTQMELEMVEDVWRSEVQDLLSQISVLQKENKKLLQSQSVCGAAPEDQDPDQREESQGGEREQEKEALQRLKELLDKQRDDIRSKEHELSLRSRDIEALQLQQSRVMKTNQDLRHRMSLLEAQGKALVQHRAELEAEAQGRLQELGSLRQEVSRLQRELQDMEEHRGEVQGFSRVKTVGSTPAPDPLSVASLTPPVWEDKASSVWAECAADPEFLANCFEKEAQTAVDSGDDEPALLLLETFGEAEDGDRGGRDRDGQDRDGRDRGGRDRDGQDRNGRDRDGRDRGGQDRDGRESPRFTLQELRDVLYERNQLKAQVFLLQEELAYFNTEDSEEDGVCVYSCSPEEGATATAAAAEPESGIRSLFFTAIMPMVAAGLISDDPTLMPIRRLVSIV